MDSLHTSGKGPGKSTDVKRYKSSGTYRLWAFTFLKLITGHMGPQARVCESNHLTDGCEIWS